MLLLPCMITASAKDFGYTEQAHEGWLHLHVPVVSSARNCWSGGGYMVAGEILVRQQSKLT